MVDLNRAYQEVKSLPDEALQRELSSPTGMLPGYLVMAELDERRAIRGGGGNPSPMSMKEEMLGGREYAKGGLIAGLNPFNAYIQGLKNPQISAGLMQEQINQMYGGLPSLMPAQTPGAPQAPQMISDMVPTSPQQPQAPMGLEALRRMG